MNVHFKSYVIRTATNEDVQAIRHVVFSVLLEYGLRPSPESKDKDLEDIEKNYLANGGFFAVAVEHPLQKVVGTFGLYTMTDHVYELRKMYLLPEARGKGLGQFMLNLAIEHARKNHKTKIYLETISPLREAIALYKKCGFRETDLPEKNARVDQAFELLIAANGIQ